MWVKVLADGAQNVHIMMMVEEISTLNSPLNRPSVELSCRWILGQ